MARNMGQTVTGRWWIPCLIIIVITDYLKVQ